MKFGIFYEHQIPRPWDTDVESFVGSRVQPERRSRCTG
jgi:hypothetical protein